MKAAILCSDYPDITQSIQLISEDDKSKIKLEISTELLNDIATKLLIITTSIQGDSKTEETVIKLTKEDSADLTTAIKKIISLM